MSKTLNALVKARVRRQHLANVARSVDNPTIAPSLAFHKGYKAPWPAASDLGRKVRRKLERRTLKRLEVSP